MHHRLALVADMGREKDRSVCISSVRKGRWEVSDGKRSNTENREQF